MREKPFTETVTFIEAVEVRDHNKEVVFRAKPGEVKELAIASARRWVKRNKAVLGKTTLSRVKKEMEEKQQIEEAARQAHQEASDGPTVVMRTQPTTSVLDEEKVDAGGEPEA